MREVVFLGEADHVARTRMRLLEAVIDQLERWALDATIESANDPFFPAARAERAWWQRSGDRKLELRLPIGLGAGGTPRAIACASFNLHERFFGAAFRIASAYGDAVASGCVGWGMERWMLACFAQHGFDPDGWPTWWRTGSFDERADRWLLAIKRRETPAARLAHDAYRWLLRAHVPDTSCSAAATGSRGSSTTRTWTP